MRKLKMLRTLAIVMAVSIAVPESALGAGMNGRAAVRSESRETVPENTKAPEDTKDSGQGGTTAATQDTGSAEDTKDTQDTGSTEGTKDTEDTGSTEDTKDTQDTGSTEDTKDTEDTGSTEDTKDTEDTGSTDDTKETEDTGSTEDTKETEDTGSTEDTKDTEDTGSTEDTKETETPGETQESGSTETPGESETVDETKGPESTDETKESTDETEAPEESEPETTDPMDEVEKLFMTSQQFIDVANRIKYNVEVPIAGLPSFITQEMVVGALKAQDEYGYPASVTIAQIIQESGYGKYGPGGEDGKGLSGLAYNYCNLFGIKGTGTAGSVSMQTMEMNVLGELYSDRAGFRAYNTYTECIEDRSKILGEVYSDLIEGVNDANTFAMRIAGRWATGMDYGLSLIRVMKQYDLYRLDELTVNSFGDMIGVFANPCPGSTITSPYGYREFDHKIHRGLDMGTGTANLPTYAAAAGTVIYVGFDNSCGNMIVIDHGDGLVTKYMHHSQMYVAVGQTVEKGQQIGLSGTTGNSTGNHLHFQVEKDGKAVDPLFYLQDSGSGKVIQMSLAERQNVVEPEAAR